MFDKILSRLHLLAGRVYVRNALNPLLWLCAVIGIPLIVGSILADGALSYLFFILLSMIVGFFMFQFNKIGNKGINFLQSEEYQLRKYQLENLGDESREFAKSEVSDKKNRREAGSFIEHEGGGDGT